MNSIYSFLFPHETTLWFTLLVICISEHSILSFKVKSFNKCCYLDKKSLLKIINAIHRCWKMAKKASENVWLRDLSNRRVSMISIAMKFSNRFSMIKVQLESATTKIFYNMVTVVDWSWLQWSLIPIPFGYSYCYHSFGVDSIWRFNIYE